ncbi:MAG TPA: hypothetical protein VF310_01545 [Vicinamibacteria bacterium]
MSPRARAAALALAAVAAAACAGRPLPPTPEVVAAARSASTLSARLKVSLRGPEVRARARVLLAFQRPDALRLELPGPSGARLIAVTRGGKLTAVFPTERAFYAGQATAEELENVLGVALTPSEVMDVLVGAGSSRLKAYDARWGPRLPRTIDATLPDGARLKVTLEDAEAGVALLEAAFSEPAHDGYRAVDAAEARSLWGGGR